jgi:hypothetical protein
MSPSPQLPQPAPTAYARWLLPAALVLFICFVRVPTWNDHILFIDEPYYYTIALRLEVPGTHIYPAPIGDQPPLGPLSFLATITYWLAITISPTHAITVVHLFTTVAMIATALLLLVTSQTILGSPWAGFVGGLLYTLVGSSDAEPDVFFSFSGLEHFQAPFLAAFVLGVLWAFERQRLWPAAAAGIALGIAASYKMNVVLLLGVPWIAALVSWRRSNTPVYAAGLLAMAATVGAVVTIGSVPLYHLMVGRFGSWRFYNVDMLATYSQMGGTWSQKAGLLAAAIPLKLLLAGGLLYGAVGAERVERSRKAGDLGIVLALVWLLLFLSLTPGQHKPHYLVQGLPAECLLIGVLVVGGGMFAMRARRSVRPYAAAAYGIVVLLPLSIAVFHLVQGWFSLRAYDSRDAYMGLHRQHGTLIPLVKYIQEHTSPADLIYVHSEAPELYFLTQRLPAVADPVGSWIAHLPSRKLADSLLAQLRMSPPRLIVQLDYRRYRRTGEALQRWPRLASWIYQNYREHAYIPHAQILEWQGDDAWPPPPPEAAEIPLSALRPETVVQTARWLRFDRNVAGHALRIGGQTYARGIGTHALSYITYRLDSAYRTFLADAGIDAAVGKRGSVVFTVEVDGIAKFTSPLVTGGTAALPVDLDVSGARTLTLEVTSGDDDNPIRWADWADWANARLIRASP